MQEKFKLTAKVSTDDIESIIKNAGIIYPNPGLSFFRAVYANVSGIANKNNVSLASSVKKDVPQLIGQQCNWEHNRNGACGSILYSFVNDNDEIEIVFSIYKTLYPNEFEYMTELMANNEVNVSFELLVDKEDIVTRQGGVREIQHCDFDGVGILLDNDPAYPEAHVYEQATIDKFREQDLVFAKQIKGDQMIQQFEGNHWSAKYINALPDTSFAVIETAYAKGESTDKRARHLPYKDHDGNVNSSHYRYALRQIDKLTPVTDSIIKEELVSVAQNVLNNVDISFNKEDTVDKKANDALLETLKVAVVTEFGEDAVKDWTEEDYTEEKIQAYRESLVVKEEKAEEKAEEEVEAEEEEKAEEKEEEKAEDKGEKAESTNYVTKTNSVYDVTYNEDNSMEIVETIVTEEETDGKVTKQEIVVRQTVYAQEVINAYEAKLEEKDIKIASFEDQVRAELKAELGEYGKSMSDEDLDNEDKVKIARLTKEKDELLAKVDKAEDGEKEEENASTKSDEHKSLETGTEGTQDDENVDIDGIIKKRYESVTGKKK